MGQWAAVFDFDGTLTPKSYISLFNVVEQGALSEKHIREMHLLRAEYMPKAIQGTITREEELDWMIKSIGVFVDARTTLEQIEMALEKVVLRDGVVECFKELRSRGVRVAVISFGIAQFVRAALRNNGALRLVDEIYATQLNLSARGGVVVGFKRDTLLLPKDKGIASLAFAKKFGIPENRILAVGDTLVDACLGGLKENRFGIAENERQLDNIREVMGEAVITRDFAPVRNWLLAKIQNSKGA